MSYIDIITYKQKNIQLKSTKNLKNEYSVLKNNEEVK